MRLNLSIEYCAVWHYTSRAAGLAADLLNAFEPMIEKVTLIPSSGGRFEVTVNETLVYSKLRTGRHIEKGEAIRLIKEYLQDHSNQETR